MQDAEEGKQSCVLAYASSTSRPSSHSSFPAEVIDRKVIEFFNVTDGVMLQRIALNFSRVLSEFGADSQSESHVLWTDITVTQQQSLLQNHLDVLSAHDSDKGERLISLCFLTLLSLVPRPVHNDSGRVLRDSRSMSFWRPFHGGVFEQFTEQNSFLTKANSLDILTKTLSLCIKDHERMIASLDIGPIRPAKKKSRSFVDKIPKDHAFWQTFQAVSQCLNCIYLNLINNRSDKTYMMQHLCTCFKDDLSLLTLLLDVFNAKTRYLFPIRKILLIFLVALEIVPGIPKAAPTLPLQPKDYAVTKTDVSDVEKAYEDVSKRFSPLLFERSMCSSCQHPRTSSPETFGSVPSSVQQRLKLVSQKLEPRIKKDCQCNQKHPLREWSLKLFNHIGLRLNPLVVAILSLLMMLSASIQFHRCDGSMQLELSMPNETVRVSGTDKRFHHDLIANSAVNVLLALMQHAKECRTAQFGSLRRTLEEKNAHLFILKLLNQEPAPKSFEEQTFSESEPAIFTREEVVLLRESTLVTILRVLQKITKGCPGPLKSMVRVKSHNVLSHFIEHENPHVQLYTLKLFKSQMKYFGSKWKNKNMDIISTIFRTLPMKLNDTWMLSENSESDHHNMTLSGE